MAGKIKRIWEALAACFDANDQPLTKGQIMAWIGVHYADNEFHPATLEAQIRRSCANVPFALKYRAPKVLFFDRRTRTYSKVSSAEPSQGSIAAFDDSGPLSDEEVDSPLEIEDQSDLLVGLEAQLRDYLAKNLTKLEKGLTFWNDSPTSVEYEIGGKRIDILAKDLDGVPVVVELKRGKAYDKVVGQALLYQALVTTEFKVRRVRVILVANVISPELQLACSKQADFKLFEYAIAMQLNPVSSFGSEEEVEDVGTS